MGRKETHPAHWSIELDDEKLAEIWGPCLERVLLKAGAATSQDTWTVRISKADP